MIPSCVHNCYIVMILTDYEDEQEKLYPGITKTKEFKYPPVLPIVYYEGTDAWTAMRNFKDRVYLSDVFGKYIPNFEYFVVPPYILFESGTN
ncbi:MAG: Rpn family recombination-promoting nuclease/putative transposase [Dorea sp.]